MTRSMSRILYLTWFTFAIQYRRTVLGPLWLLVGPSLFVAVLGLLFSEVYGIAAAVYVPHLAIGLVVWNLIAGVVNGGATVFARYRGQVLHGGMSLAEILAVDGLKTVIQFLHQALIAAAVMALFGVPLTLYSALALLGFALLVYNCGWFLFFFGVVGSRFRDVGEIVSAIMRIAFLATPIIWMPGAAGRGGVLGAFLTYNPFYHFLEIVRAPLLGNPISPVTWLAVGGISVIGTVLAAIVYRGYSRYVPLWV